MKVEPEQSEQNPYIGLEHVTSWTGQLLMLNDQHEPESLCNSFHAGTVLLGKLRPYLAKAFCADFNGLCSTEFLVLKPVAYQQRYLFYLLLTNEVISLIHSSTFGARANWGFVGALHLPIPSTPRPTQLNPHSLVQTSKTNPKHTAALCASTQCSPATRYNHQ